MLRIISIYLSLSVMGSVLPQADLVAFISTPLLYFRDPSPPFRGRTLSTQKWLSRPLV